MKMKHSDALSILGLKLADLKEVSTAINLITDAYRLACKKYHPDRNPAGLEMMKIINVAYDALEDIRNGASFDSSIKQALGDEFYGDELNNALNAIINLGLNVEVCGSWVWVSGNTKLHKTTLKEAGYKWAPQKEMWHFRPAGYKSFNRGKWNMETIRARHGSQLIKPKSYIQLES